MATHLQPWSTASLRRAQTKAVYRARPRYEGRVAARFLERVDRHRVHRRAVLPVDSRQVLGTVADRDMVSAARRIDPTAQDIGLDHLRHRGLSSAVVPRWVILPWPLREKQPLPLCLLPYFPIDAAFYHLRLTTAPFRVGTSWAGHSTGKGRMNRASLRCIPPVLQRVPMPQQRRFVADVRDRPPRERISAIRLESNAS